MLARELLGIEQVIEGSTEGSNHVDVHYVDIGTLPYSIIINHVRRRTYL